MDGFDERKGSAHRKMVEFVGKNKEVLEIGCGRGFVSERLKQNGCAVSAIEVNAESAKEAKRFCKDLIVGDIETIELKFKPKGFDVILLGDVLEHLKQPGKALQKLKPLLKDDGIIVVSIPNIANWKVRLNLLVGKFDYTDWGILDRTHLHFFTRKTARQLIESNGYKIVRSDFVPSFPFPFFKVQLAKIDPNAFAFQFIFAAKKVQ